jgi:hypothetical protein
LVAGEGDGPGVDESFDDGWGGSGGEGVAGLVVAVELVAFAVQVGLGGVEVLRPGAVVIAAGGVASADEAEQFALVVDGATSRSRNRSMTRPVRA